MNILSIGKRADNGKWAEENYIRKNHPQFKEPTFWCSLIQDMALSVYEVIPETIEINLFGEWIKLSGLENYKLVKK